MATNYKHLGQLGLEQLLQLMAAEFAKVQYEEAGKGLSANDFTDALLNKLNGIADNANNYTHPAHDEHAAGFYKVTVDAEGHVTAVTEVAKADITALGIPGQDTTYVIATTEKAGLMSTDDRTKLDGIDEGANNYTHPAHTARTSGLYKITVDAEGHVTAASTVTKAELDELIGVASSTANGLLSKEDKAIIDGLGSLASKSEVADGDLNADLKKKIDDTATKAGQNETAIGVLNGDATKAGSVAKAAADAQSAAQTYADGKVKALSDGQVTTNKNAIATLNGDAETPGSVQKTVKDYVATQVSSAYKAGGSKTYETLPDVAAAADAASYEGYVYNMSNDFTTDADFVEGAGHQYKAGTNVVIVKVGDAYKYDVLAMSFDGFVQEANVSEYSADEITQMWNSVFTA